MFSEKDCWNSLPDDLQFSLGPILDRYQRHLMRLEAEVAELRKVLPQLHALLIQQGRTALPHAATTPLWPHSSEQAKDS